MAKKYVQIHPKDNMIVALEDLKKGDPIELAGRNLNLTEDIPAKHKFALLPFDIDAHLFMYGVLVGQAKEVIAAGARISTENVVHAASSYADKGESFQWSAPDVSKWSQRTFNGFHRADGRVGTGNYWIVVPLVFCENRNIGVMEGAMLDELGYSTKKDFAVNTHALIEKYKSGASTEELLATDIISGEEEMLKNRPFPNVDGIKFLRHDGGCGGIRQDAEALCQLLAGYITHPNVAGATVLSLGCQNAEIRMLEEAIQQKNSGFDRPLHILEQQKSKSERHFIEDAVKRTFLGLIEANKEERKLAPLSKLTVGLECGGSDGFSGISANPALGYASDLIVGLGGTPILSEFPELNGVEQDLINRCVDETIAEKFASLMRAYSQRAVDVGSGFENNPSPGNIKDGLITDAMKSAGAAKKGGTSPVTDVLDYTETSTKPGLNLLCTPGNDVESTTGLAGSGANIIVFTTGLGTPTGNPIAPVIKLSSNTKLSTKMKDVIDINAGTVISGEDTIESKGEEILEYIIKVASGDIIPKATKLGQDDFIPWKRGISL